ncbi:MAG: LacI family DNA-binding transcriptional regulator [Bacteroidota bacterium]|nr:LacI family DNA-binding transcriptional regulator [Bacteroidota bacterium]
MSTKLKDIAQKTGFSLSTVSRVLHKGSQKVSISAETTRIIKKTAEDLGYRPNIIARSLRTEQTHEIGILVPDISNPFFSTIVKNLASELRKFGYGTVVYDTDENTSLEEESLRQLLDKRVDGLIIAAVGQEAKHFKEIVKRGIPLVTLDRCFNDFDVDAVSVDNVYGAMIAVQYLLNEGHQRVAFIQGLPGTYASDERKKGYCKVLDIAGIPIDPTIIVGSDFRAFNGYIETKHLLSMKNPPTAIFSASDLITLGVLEALREEKKIIPQEISLVTFDDPYFTKYLSPAITAVAQPIERMVEIAVNLLFRRMKNPKEQSRRVLLEPSLIIRNSVLRVSKLSAIININNTNS